MLISRPDPQLAKTYTEYLTDMENRLKAVSDDRQKSRTEVSDTIISYLGSKVYETMKGIDVDELARGRQGIKLTALKNAGITNTAQLLGKSVTQLKYIQGVGEQSACLIHNAVREMETAIRDMTGIRLTDDPYDRMSAELIRSIYIFRESRAIIRRVIELYNANHPVITRAVNDLAVCEAPFTWLLSSAETKSNAVAAMETCRNLIRGDYAQQANTLIKAYSELKNVSEAKVLSDFRENSAAYYTVIESFRPNTAVIVDEDSGLSEDLIHEVDAEPLDLTGMKTELRKYQEFGSKYVLNRKRVLLGDEMGLGKTVEAIAAMVALRNGGATHFLVVCPAGVIINWCREIEKHSDLKPIEIHRNYSAELAQWITDGGVGVTTYETITKLFLPDSVPLALLVADEAHYAKNPGAQRTQALMRLSLSAKRLLYMTGTPLENRVDEMCFLVNCLQPDIAEALEKKAFLSSAAMFRQIASPVYLRRTREKVLKELPELIETQDWCELGGKESSLYLSAVSSENMMAMRQVSWNVEDVKDSSKAARLAEIAAEAEENGERVIVFSFFLNTLRQAEKVLGERCKGVITGSVAPAQRQAIIDDFAKSPAGSALAAQIQAGGTGLNIQSANIVVICEPQFKPSTEDQAISRAYRMGQVKNVLVHRLLAADTVDERITDILAEKKLEFQSFAHESVSGEKSLELTEKEDAVPETALTAEDQKSIILQEKARLLS